MTRYRKLPVEVEAFKWTGDEHQTEDTDWICKAIQEGNVIINSATTSNKLEYGKPVEATPCQMAIHTLEGVMFANPGDYIILGTKGEIYPCKPDIFESIYEKVK